MHPSSIEYTSFRGNPAFKAFTAKLSREIIKSESRTLIFLRTHALERRMVGADKSKILIFSKNLPERKVDLHITVNGLEIPQVNQIKYLGTIWQGNLKFDKDMAEKRRTLYYRAHKFNNKIIQKSSEAVKNLYFSSFKCVYGISVWLLGDPSSLRKMSTVSAAFRYLYMKIFGLNTKLRTSNTILFKNTQNLYEYADKSLAGSLARIKLLNSELCATGLGKFL